MKRFATTLSCIILAVLLLSLIIPDDPVEELKKRLYEYINEKPITNLYLHLDKNNYAPSEDIWFKAYILSGIIPITRFSMYA